MSWEKAPFWGRCFSKAVSLGRCSLLGTMVGGLALLSQREGSPSHRTGSVAFHSTMGGMQCRLAFGATASLSRDICTMQRQRKSTWLPHLGNQKDDNDMPTGLSKPMHTQSTSWHRRPLFGAGWSWLTWPLTS